MSKLEKLGKKVDDLLDKKRQARLKELNAIELLLFNNLFNELRDSLSEDDRGRITSKKGFVSLSKAIDTIFDAIQAKHLSDLANGAALDMREILTFNANYYRVLAVNKGEQFQSITDAVNAAMSARLGITDTGAAKNGYLDQLLNADPARDEIKKLVAKSVAAGVPMKKLRRDLENRITGTGETAGLLEKHLHTFLFDTYSVADSITNNEFGSRLGLKYFIYAGGLIETSREFCIEKNNKVFSTDEANRDWPKDPNLPLSKAEEKSGEPSGYVPLEDRGRYNCRHRIAYISEEEAFRRRPDLAPKRQKE